MTSTHTNASKRLDAALAILRIVVGGTFVAHGAQKLFTYGLQDVSGGFAQIGIPYSEIIGPVIAFLEFFGGLALIFGLFTRVVSLGLALDMLGAIYFVHLKNGFFLPNGYEFVLMLCAANVAFMLAGAGAWSLDAWRAARRRTYVVTRTPLATGTPRHA